MAMKNRWMPLALVFVSALFAPLAAQAKLGETLPQLVKRFGKYAGLVSLFACQPFTSEHSTLARVTVYWRGDGSGDHASSNGARLRESHCAVDPKKIPYGSKVVFPDAVCLAVDCGTDVVNRKAARLSGRNVAERNAIVIDRFFETKQKALAWAKAHPHFMTVQILTPGTEQGTKLLATKNPKSSPRNQNCVAPLSDAELRKVHDIKRTLGARIAG
jgi:3D (Asp-Asp-Asp) domain-containing protein